jgi:hypothetical protein
MTDLHDAREMAGPFLILGVDKDVDDAKIESQYELQRAAVERGECHWSIDDLEWAKRILNDPYRRLEADLDNLNSDLASGEVHRLQRLYHLDGSPPGWEAIDPEPPIDLPNNDAIDPLTLTKDIPTPEIPFELPAINAWLEQFAAAITDPWTMELSGN